MQLHRPGRLSRACYDKAGGAHVTDRETEQVPLLATLSSNPSDFGLGGEVGIVATGGVIGCVPHPVKFHTMCCKKQCFAVCGVTGL